MTQRLVLQRTQDNLSDLEVHALETVIGRTTTAQRDVFFELFDGVSDEVAERIARNASANQSLTQTLLGNGLGDALRGSTYRELADLNPQVVGQLATTVRASNLNPAETSQLVEIVFNSPRGRVAVDFLSGGSLSLIHI